MTDDSSLCGWLVETNNSHMRDVLYIDYECEDEFILLAHGMGITGSFPILKFNVTPLEKYKTVAQRIFSKTFNYIISDDNLYCVKNYGGQMSLDIIHNNGFFNLGTVAFLYEIPNDNQVINLVYQSHAKPDDTLFEKLLNNYQTCDCEELDVGTMDNVSEHDLCATDFTIVEYQGVK